MSIPVVERAWNAYLERPTLQTSGSLPNRPEAFREAPSLPHPRCRLFPGPIRAKPIARCANHDLCTARLKGLTTTRPGANAAARACGAPAAEALPSSRSAHRPGGRPGRTQAESHTLRKIQRSCHVLGGCSTPSGWSKSHHETTPPHSRTSPATPALPYVTDFADERTPTCPAVPRPARAWTPECALSSTQPRTASCGRRCVHIHAGMPALPRKK